MRPSVVTAYWTNVSGIDAIPEAFAAAHAILNQNRGRNGLADEFSSPSDKAVDEGRKPFVEAVSRRHGDI